MSAASNSKNSANFRLSRFNTNGLEGDAPTRSRIGSLNNTNRANRLSVFNTSANLNTTNDDKDDKDDGLTSGGLNSSGSGNAWWSAFIPKLSRDEIKQFQQDDEGRLIESLKKMSSAMAFLTALKTADKMLWYMIGAVIVLFIVMSYLAYYCNMDDDKCTWKYNKMVVYQTFVGAGLIILIYGIIRSYIYDIRFKITEALMIAGLFIVYQIFVYGFVYQTLADDNGTVHVV